MTWVGSVLVLKFWGIYPKCVAKQFYSMLGVPFRISVELLFLTEVVILFRLLTL